MGRGKWGTVIFSFISQSALRHGGQCAWLE